MVDPVLVPKVDLDQVDLDLVLVLVLVLVVVEKACPLVHQDHHLLVVEKACPLVHMDHLVLVLVLVVVDRLADYLPKKLLVHHNHSH